MIPILLMSDWFQELIVSQILLSVQLPVTVFLLLRLTSSGKVMGKFKNTRLGNVMLWGIGAIVVGLNVALLISLLK